MQLRDIRFTLFEHLKVQEELGTDVESLDPILDAAAKCCRDVLAPSNAVGDDHPPVRHPDGKVTAGKGYKGAFDQFVADGWASMSAPEADGGQGLAQTLITSIDELIIGAC